MAIKIKRGSDYLYKANEGFINKPEKVRADHIYRDAQSELSRIKVQKDALALWHARGVLANKLIAKHAVSDDEKKFFWIMLYDADSLVPAGKKIPEKNDFQTASILAVHDLSDLREVGSWSLWREMIGSHRIIKDTRVASWVANQIIENNVTRDKSRPLLKCVRNRLKVLDTTVLSNDELVEKLNSCRFS